MTKAMVLSAKVKKEEKIGEMYFNQANTFSVVEV